MGLSFTVRGIGVIMCVLLAWTSLSPGTIRQLSDIGSGQYASNEQSVTNSGVIHPGSEPSFLSPQQRTFETTIVTAYFDIPSKRSKEAYFEWMRDMLRIGDPMVIFTSPDMVERMISLRSSHPADQTLIIPLNFDDLSVFSYNDTFWQKQYAKDPQGGKRLSKLKQQPIVQGWQLYKLWFAKPLFVLEAIDRNPFGSSVYVWCDIGQFRDAREDWTGRTLASHPEVVPQDQMIFLATTLYYSRPRKPVNSPWFRRNGHFVAGGSFAGRVHVWKQYVTKFEDTVRGYAKRNLGVYDDQPIILSTCIQNAQLCRLVTPQSRLGNAPSASNSFNASDLWTFEGGKQLSEYPGDGFFTFKYLLYHGGDDLDLWFPGRDGDAEKDPLVPRLESGVQ